MRAVAVAALVGVALLAGCAATAPGTEAGGEGSAAGGSLTGPWADVFEYTYAEATSDDERRALVDGAISAEEYAYFQDKIVTCLKGLGVTGTFASNGSLQYTKPRGVSNDEIRDCNAENGIRVITLHDAILRNPANQDEGTIMLDCLIRTGVVGEGYTRADLDNGVDIETLGADPDFAACAADPLGYEAD